MYTIETLTEFNADNNNILPIKEKDVEIVNAIIASLANNLTNPLPCSGDNVVMIGENREGAVRYDNGHCEGDGYKPNTANLCTRPMSPFISMSSTRAGKHYCSTSGGYWIGAAPHGEIVNTGRTTEYLFWTWGSRGSGGHMGIYFMATVKQMEYTDLKNIY